MHPATYRALVEGVLQDDEVQELVGWRIVERGAGTAVLEGTLVDQPALLGTIARLEDLGCQVRDLHAVDPAAAGADGP